MNAHEAMVAAVKSKLLEVPPIAGGNVERGRRRPIDEGIEEFVSVYFAGSSPTRGSIKGAPIDWRTGVRFDCQARGRGAVSGDEAALALHGQAWNRLFSDPQLGGLVMDMEPLPVAPSDEDELGTALGSVSGAVLLLHRTAGNSLEISP